MLKCKIKFFIFFSFLFLSSVSSSTAQYNLVKEISIEASFVTIDQLGNTYALVSGNIYKYDETGSLQFSYSNKGAGLIRFIDASNPMRILLYIPDFFKVIVLDSRLVFQSAINLNEFELFLPTLVCASKSDGFWVYESQTQQLRKYNFSMQKQNESIPLSQIITDTISPVMLAESDNWLVVNNPSNGLLLFDKYGNYFKTYPVKYVPNFQVMDDRLVYPAEGALVQLNIRTGEEHKINLPQFNENDVFLIDSHHLIVHKKNSISFYTY